MQEEYKNILKTAHEYVVNDTNLDKAIEIYESFLINDPHSFSLLFHEASAFMKKKMFGVAINLYEAAVNQKPDFIEALNNIGLMYKETGRLEEATKYFDNIIEIIETKNIDISDIEKSEFYTNHGSVYIMQGTPYHAIKSFEKALELNPKNEEAMWNRALAYLELGDYFKGFNGYEYGKRTQRHKDRTYDIHDANTPIWDGEPGKTVVVYGEQGIGDEIMFASIIPDLMKDCNVIIDAHPRLIEIFRRSFPSAYVFGTRKLPSKDIGWFRGCFKSIKPDAQIAMGSLGKFYRHDVKDFPGTAYLVADPKYVDEYSIKLNSLGPRPKIGISWKGGTISTNRMTRKIALTELLPLFKLDFDFISLQYDKNISHEIEKFKKDYGIDNLYHWQDMVDDYDKTAGLVSALDFVISVPQSVVHLAGALGVPTMQLCPVRSMWQVGPYGQNMPWYRSVRNVWQDRTVEYKWDSVINYICEYLCNLSVKNT